MATTYTKIGDILTAFWKRAKKVVDAGDAETLEAAKTYADDSVASAIKTNVTDKIGKANGFATLDENGQIPASQLTISAMEFKGNWDASTNTPTLVDGTGNTGDFYIVSTGNGVDEYGNELTTLGEHFLVNDRVIYNGSEWVRLVGDTVLSVNGQTGAATLTASNLEYEASKDAVTYTLTEDDATDLNNTSVAKITATVGGVEYTFNAVSGTTYAEGDVVTLKAAEEAVTIYNKIDSLSEDMEEIAQEALSISTTDIDSMIGTVTSDDGAGHEVITYVPDEIEATVQDE